MKIDVTTAT